MKLFFIVYTDCFLDSGMPRSVEMGGIALGDIRGELKGMFRARGQKIRLHRRKDEWLARGGGGCAGLKWGLMNTRREGMEISVREVNGDEQKILSSVSLLFESRLKKL